MDLVGAPNQGDAVAAGIVDAIPVHLPVREDVLALGLGLVWREVDLLGGQGGVVQPPVVEIDRKRQVVARVLGGIQGVDRLRDRVRDADVLGDHPLG